MSPGLDISYLRQWIGRTEIVRDCITPRLLCEYAAMMDDEPAQDLAPLAIHWCLSPAAAKTSALGPDGHPARGGFLPPVALPRRMWAGGSLRLVDRLRRGDDVLRRSQITDVTIKQGRTGTLCFVTLAHEIHSPRGLAITEAQNIVYRESVTHTNRIEAVQAPAADWAEQKTADSFYCFAIPR